MTHRTADILPRCTGVRRDQDITWFGSFLTVFPHHNQLTVLSLAAQPSQSSPSSPSLSLISCTSMLKGLTRYSGCEGHEEKDGNGLSSSARYLGWWGTSRLVKHDSIRHYRSSHVSHAESYSTTTTTTVIQLLAQLTVHFPLSNEIDPPIHVLNELLWLPWTFLHRYHRRLVMTSRPRWLLHTLR